MEPEDITIGSLFSSRFPICVPKYQRAYSWEKEEIDDFIKDIIKIYEFRKMNPQVVKKHFFGGVVSIQINQPGTGTGRKYELVDGQQRLATFAISLSKIITSIQNVASQAKQIGDTNLSTRAEAYITQMKDQLVKYGEVIDNKLCVLTRLSLSKVDNQYFQQILDNTITRPNRESHRRIYIAFEKIEQQLISPIINSQSMNLNEKLDQILLLKSCLTENCNVIHIWTDDRSEAYKLFTVLNDRGISLSDGDLLRSTSMELLESFPPKQDIVSILWDEILSGKTNEIDKYLRCYFASINGQRAPQRDLFDHFRNTFFNYQGIISDSQSQEIVDRVTVLRDELDFFTSISDGEWPYSSGINPMVTNWDRARLKIVSTVFRHSLCFPLLQSAAIKLDETIFSNIVNLIEKFSFRYIIISGAHPGGIEDIYYRFAREIRNNSQNFNINQLMNELRSFINQHAPDQAFDQQLLIELDNDQSSKKKLIRYFLTTLESYAQWYETRMHTNPEPDKMIAFNFDQTTIEHIYPRNAQAQYIDIDLEPKKNTIGNLSIWPPTENGRVGNNPFTQKIPYYQTSSVRLNRWLTVNAQWTLQEFLNRQQQILNLANRIFSF